MKKKLLVFICLLMVLSAATVGTHAMTHATSEIEATLDQYMSKDPKMELVSREIFTPEEAFEEGIISFTDENGDPRPPREDEIGWVAIEIYNHIS